MDGLFIIILVLAVVGLIITIPFWILSILELYFEKKLYLVHVLLNAPFILLPIFVLLNSHFSSPEPARMIHGPTPELIIALLFVLLFVSAYPALLLFYMFGIKFLEHYFLESYKSIRFSLIIIYLIYTVLLIVLGVFIAIDEGGMNIELF